MQHGKLFTETCSCVLNSRRNHNTFASVKGHIGKQVLRWFFCVCVYLNFQFYFIHYNICFVNEKCVSLNKSQINLIEKKFEQGC